MKVEIIKSGKYAIVEIINKGRFSVRSFVIENVGMIYIREQVAELARVLGCKYSETKEKP